MDSVTNLNLVVQQGGSVKKIQNPKQQPHDMSQTELTQQSAKDEELEKTRVQHADNPDKLKFDNRKLKNKRQQYLRSKKKKKKEENNDLDPDVKGNLLNTVG